MDGNSNILDMTASCTSKCQPMNVCLNKPFKAILKKCWIKHISSVLESFAEACKNCSFKLPVPTRRYTIDWVKEGFSHLVERLEMIKRFFKVCSIISLSINSAWKRHYVTWRHIRKQRRFTSFDCRRLDP